jgi:hypothetical protein
MPIMLRTPYIWTPNNCKPLAEVVERWVGTRRTGIG